MKYVLEFDMGIRFKIFNRMLCSEFYFVRKFVDLVFNSISCNLIIIIFYIYNSVFGIYVDLVVSLVYFDGG